MDLSQPVVHTHRFFTHAAFLSHCWDDDELGRDNHQRVVLFANELQRLGLRVWIDENEMTGDIVKRMQEGIDNSATVVVFITKRY